MEYVKWRFGIILNDLFTLWCGPLWFVLVLTLGAFVIGAATAVWIMERTKRS
jgi:hypothetical protein